MPRDKDRRSSDYRVIERDGVIVLQQRRRMPGRARKYIWVDVWSREKKPEPPDGSRGSEGNDSPPQDRLAEIRASAAGRT